MRMLACLIAALALGGCSQPASQDSKPQTPPAAKKNPLRGYQLAELERITLDLKGTKANIWVMDNGGKITEGMMYLEKKDVKDNEGMIFVFPDAQPRSFWMKNCPLGLDIAFMDPKGKILNIQNGKPFDETPLPSKGKSQYVLEMKAGTLKRLGVKAGDALKIPKGLSNKG
jgi:uncharacterized protein